MSVLKCVKWQILFGLMASASITGTAGTIYVKAGATGSGDGSSWANAYTDVAAAVGKANETGNAVYIAKGVYTVSGVMSVVNISAIYGGFSGEDDAETVEERQIDVNRTILTGDAERNDYWCHVEPGEVGSYACTKTELPESPLFKDGELQFPPAFTGDYDTYIPNIDTNNASAAFSISSAVDGVIDGLWFAGFCGNNDAIVTYVSGTKAVNLVNCRFLGNTAHKGSVLGSSDNVQDSYRKLVGCKFMFTGVRILAKNSDAAVCGVDLGYNGYLTVEDCEFLSLSAVGGSGQYKNWAGATCLKYAAKYASSYPLQLTINGCRFVRAYAYQPNVNVASCGNVFSDTSYSSVRFNDCVCSNCLTVSAGKTANDFGFAAKEVNGCVFLNNRHEQKGGAARVFSYFGGAGEARRQFFNSCSFVGNVYRVTDSTLTDGDLLVSLFGHPDMSKAPTCAFVGCVFDDNTVEADVPDGVTAHLCRGVTAYATLVNLACEMSVAGCTFIGPRVEGVVDVMMYDSSNNLGLNIVDSIFEYTTGEPYDGFEFANPSIVSLYSCTLANNARPDVPFAIEDHDYDYVPFVTNFVGTTGRPVLVPAARTPLLRQSADLVCNGSTFTRPYWMTNYAFRAHGSDEWQALTPGAKALDADVLKNPQNYICNDAAGTERPFGSTTRGAVQNLTDLAENGVTLVLRREPFESGTFDGPQVQAVAVGAAITPVTVVAVDPQASPFLGWYDESGALFSDRETLEIASMAARDEPLVLTARFEASKTKVVFDLGEHATFDDTGLHTAELEAAQGEDFPAVPPFTVDDGWVFAKWQPTFPVAVPDHDVAYTAKVVTTSLRTIRVDAGSTAVEPDGLSWESAYASFAEAYADAAVCRGEVWVKEGVHPINASIVLRSNVVVRGGFAGNETSADEADPAAHRTILSGDLSEDDVWKGSSGTTYGKILSDGVIALANPDLVKDSYWSVVNTFEDTLYCFTVEENVENIGFSGLTFVGFKRGAIRDAIGGESPLVVTNCDFVACKSDANETQDCMTLEVTSRSTVVADCRFQGCRQAVSLNGAAANTNVVRNCRFDANLVIDKNINGGPVAACGVAMVGSGVSKVENCAFSRNYLVQHGKVELGTSCYCAPSATGEATVQDCSFTSNRMAKMACGDVAACGSGVVRVERCRFVGGRSVKADNSSWARLMASSAGVGANHSGRLVVRDSYFGDCAATADDNVPHVAVLAVRSGESAFVNCTVEDCAATSVTDLASLFMVRSGGKLGLVNCLVRGSMLAGDDVGLFAYDSRDAASSSSGDTIAIVNSAILDGLPMFRLRTGAAPALANDYIAGLDTNGIETAYCYNVATSGLERSGEVEEGPNGALGAVVRVQQKGRGVWLAGDNSVYFHDDVANPAKLWRKVADKGSFAASVSGLDLDSPIIPDAFGAARRYGRVKIGPVGWQPGLVLMVR